MVQVSFPSAERDKGAAPRLAAVGRPAENRMLVFIFLLVELRVPLIQSIVEITLLMFLM